MSPRLRCFGENAEIALKKAMHGAPESIQRCKRQLIQLLVYCLKRFTAINHLSSSARKVVENKEQMSTMLKDYCKIVGDISPGLRGEYPFTYHSVPEYTQRLF